MSTAPRTSGRLGTPISRLAFLTLVAPASRRLFCLRLNFAVAIEFDIVVDFVAAACFFRRASLTLQSHLTSPLPSPVPSRLPSPLNLRGPVQLHRTGQHSPQVFSAPSASPR